MYRHICDPLGQSFSVEKDGQPLQDVVYADDVSGQAVIYAHDREGNRIPDSDSSLGYETLVVIGKIKIIDHPRQEPLSDPQPDPQLVFDPSWFGCPT